jgi:hypothetical protein
MNTPSFESFPRWMVAVCSAHGLAIYAIGFALVALLGPVCGAMYVAYCLGMEWRLMAGSCRSCYYYGKRCGFGRGRICAWLFAKKADPTLSQKCISWRSVVPDFLGWLVPLGVGIGTLVGSFSWRVLILVVALLVLGSGGTALVRGQLACKYCRQRELGCPAQQLFAKRKHA